MTSAQCSLSSLQSVIKRQAQYKGAHLRETPESGRVGQGKGRETFRGVPLGLPYLSRTHFSFSISVTAQRGSGYELTPHLDSTSDRGVQSVKRREQTNGATVAVKRKKEAGLGPSPPSFFRQAASIALCFTDRMP